MVSANLLGYIDDLDAIISDVLLLRSLAENTPTCRVRSRSAWGECYLIHAPAHSELAGIIVCGAGILVPANIQVMVKLSIFLGRVLPTTGSAFFEPQLGRRRGRAVKADPLFYREDSCAHRI